MSNLLSLRGVCFCQDRQTILHHIDFSLQKGKVLGLLGVNGAGKSTTLKIAAGLLKPTSGNVEMTPSVTLGFLPERPPLIEAWTVRGFLTHVCLLRGIAKHQRTQNIDNVIDQCDLSRIVEQTISTLSKGNRQRLAIAQSLIHNPAILILDEPTSGLDPKQISHFRQLIHTIKPDTAILLSSHIMQEMSSLCDRIAIIHEGKIKETVTLEKKDIVIDFYQDIPASALDSLPQWQSGKGKSHQFHITSPEEQTKVLTQLLGKNYHIRRVVGAEQILENRFLQLIGQKVESD